MPSPIEQLIEAISGASVKMEIIALKDGQTIEELIKSKGLKPVGDDCPGCGMHHEYEAPNGDKVFVTPADDEENETPVSEDITASEVKEAEDRRASALAGIRKRQAKVLKMYDILKDMERSIMAPAEERDIKDLFKEITAYVELQQLARSL